MAVALGFLVAESASLSYSNTAAAWEAGRVKQFYCNFYCILLEVIIILVP